MKKAFQTLGVVVSLASLSMLTGCSTAREVTFPTGRWWGYVVPSPTTGADELIITFDRVACNTARARYVRRMAAPVYIDECRQVYLEKGGGFWIVPAADVDGYLGSRTLEECEVVGRRQFSDYGQGDRVCQSAKADFR